MQRIKGTNVRIPTTAEARRVEDELRRMAAEQHCLLLAHAAQIIEALMEALYDTQERIGIISEGLQEAMRI